MKHTMSTMALASLLALPAVSHAQQRSIDVDVTQLKGQLDRFNLPVGAGRANEALRADC